jgi:hypothetical protein
MEILRCKRIPHPTYLPDLTIAGFYIFGKIKEELRIKQASSEEEAVEVVTGILRKISHPELKSIFDYCVYGCD